MPQKQLLIISPGFAAHEADYNCIPPLQMLIQAFLTENITVQVITLEYPYTQSEFSWHSAQVSPMGGRNSIWRKPLTLWKAYQTAVTWVYKNKNAECAVLSCWLGWASFVGERLASRFQLRHFTLLMGQDVLPANGWRLKRLRQERFQRLIAVSAFQNQVLQEQTGHLAGHVIPWGIQGLPTAGNSGRSPLILGVGSLISLKNWEKWLQTLAHFLPGHPDYQAILIGDGPEKARLEQRCRALQLEHSVRLIGSLPRPEVIAYMQQASVLLHTSEYESYGFVLAEAMACGAQVVSTPTGIATELGITTGKTPEQLAMALGSVLIKPVVANTLPNVQSMVQAYITRLFPPEITPSPPI
ncbi:MAG TPA: glycosyltransferase [Saprospiraceae bacterium]|nr:glycosyltransferase [Saprospiraceae bacterium]